jgi:ADP-heptose:LPS heptosyltransferase
MSERPSILVLAAGSLGDCVLTLPALRALQAMGEVTVAGTPPFQALGSELLGVAKVLPLDPLLQVLLSKGAVDPCGPAFFKPYSDLYLFFKERDAKLEGILGPMVPRTHAPTGPFAEFLKEGRWAAEYWLETAVGRAVPYDSPLRHAKLEVGETLKERGRGILESLGMGSPLVIHPGSGSVEKNAPLPFFRNAAQKASGESGKQVLVIWGEAEEGYLGAIREVFTGLPGVTVLPKALPLKDLVALFSVSSAYLGNDSGVTQLAAAVGLRTFAVFGATDPGIWGPQEAVILAAMRNLYK